MRLKFEGYSYKEISTMIPDITLVIVKEWFRTGGKLREFYKAYARDEAAARREIALEFFKAHLDDAVKVLFKLMANSPSDMVKLLAAKEIINRELGEPKKVIQAEVNNPARDILEGAGLINDRTETNQSD